MFVFFFKKFFQGKTFVFLLCVFTVVIDATFLSSSSDASGLGEEFAERRTFKKHGKPLGLLKKKKFGGWLPQLFGGGNVEEYSSRPLVQTSLSTPVYKVHRYQGVEVKPVSVAEVSFSTPKPVEEVHSEEHSSHDHHQFESSSFNSHDHSSAFVHGGSQNNGPDCDQPQTTIHAPAFPHFATSLKQPVSFVSLPPVTPQLTSTLTLVRAPTLPSVQFPPPLPSFQLPPPLPPVQFPPPLPSIQFPIPNLPSLPFPTPNPPSVELPPPAVEAPAPTLPAVQLPPQTPALALRLTPLNLAPLVTQKTSLSHHSDFHHHSFDEHKPSLTPVVPPYNNFPVQTVTPSPPVLPPVPSFPQVTPVPPAPVLPPVPFPPVTPVPSAPVLPPVAFPPVTPVPVAPVLPPVSFPTVTPAPLPPAPVFPAFPSTPAPPVFTDHHESGHSHHHSHGHR